MPITPEYREHNFDEMSLTELDLELMKIAIEETKYSDDPKSKIDRRTAVGALLYKDGHIIAKSANRLPPILRPSHEIDDVDLEIDDSDDKEDDKDAVSIDDIEVESLETLREADDAPTEDEEEND